MTSRNATEAELLQSDLETFGQTLEHSGVLTINPNGLVNNCVSVSIAKLLAYRDVHEFCHDVLHTDLPDLGLTFCEIKRLISRTGWNFTCTVYTSSGGESAYSKMHRDLYPSRPSAGPFHVVAYTRSDGVGHCVIRNPWDEMVTQRLDTPSGQSLPFTCYQRDKYGTNVDHEVQAAEKLVVFNLRCPRTTAQYDTWMNRLCLRTMERRRDLVLRVRRMQLVNDALKALGESPLSPSEEAAFHYKRHLNSEKHTTTVELLNHPSNSLYHI
ncbi:hypothetical protein F5Y03DRAFT_363290 [Xylaria venustula]|nr:hypothetical protein F5Y03DRAFT_363290 [Xylaria venustula]